MSGTTRSALIGALKGAMRDVARGSRCRAHVQPCHSDNRPLWLVSIDIETGSDIYWLGPRHPQVVVQSRAFMDDFGSLVYAEPFR